MPTIRDVAAKAGVSIASVSRVLSGSPNIRPEMRARVLAAVDELGYRPNRAARQLRSRKSATIGMIVSDIRNPFFAAVIRAAEDTASANEWNVFLCNADEDPAKEEQYIEALSAQQVAGIVLSPTAVMAEKFAEVVTAECPMVVIDREVTASHVDQIGIDNVRAAAEVTGQLLERGHRRVAAVFGNASSTGVARHRGFLQAHAERALSVDDALIQFMPPHARDGEAQMEHFLAQDQPPDAVFASNGALASGIARAAQRRGLRVGRDIALACFDRPEWIDILGMPVHVVEQPTDEIGRMAVKLLLERLEEPKRPARRLILAHEITIVNPDDGPLPT